MGNWGIKVYNVKNEVLIRFTCDQNRIAIGSSNNADLKLPGNDIDEINLIVEIKDKSQKLIVSPSGNNPIILNGKILNMTRFINPGDKILIGSYLLIFERIKAENKPEQKSDVVEILLTFSHTGKTDHVKTLPGYFCYDEKNHDLYWSPDLYDENRLVKIYIDKGRFMARNLYKKQNILLNGRPLKKEKISNGDTITINGLHCIFNLKKGEPTIRKKSGIKRLYETTLSYTHFGKEKKINLFLILSLFLLLLIFIAITIRYIKIESPTEIKEQIIKELSSPEFNQERLNKKEQLLSFCLNELYVVSKYEKQFKTVFEKINYIEKKPEAKLLGLVLPETIGIKINNFKETLSLFFNFNNQLMKLYDSFSVYQDATKLYKESQTFSNAKNLKQAATQFLNDYKLLNNITEKLVDKINNTGELKEFLRIVKTTANLMEFNELAETVNSVFENYQHVMSNIKRIRTEFEADAQIAKNIINLVTDLEEHNESSGKIFIQ